MAPKIAPVVTCASKVCPAKDRQNPEIKAIKTTSRLNMSKKRKSIARFLPSTCQKIDRSKLERIDIRTSQLITPLFLIFRCLSGCGETPVGSELLTQLMAIWMLIANATGPVLQFMAVTCPLHRIPPMRNGHGPAWANSLFER
ncbi:hypothetical protein ACLK1T_28430 [Escherichia coli]